MRISLRARRPLLPVLAVATTALLVLGACGDDGGDNAAPVDPNAGLTGQPVKIGLITDQSGVNNYTYVANAAQAGVLAVNEAGGVGGRPLELVVCDSKSEPNAAAACGRQMVEEQVLAVLGSPYTFIDNAFSVYSEAGIPNLCNSAIGSQESTNPLSFPCTHSLIQGGSEPYVAKAAGATELRVVVVDVPAAQFGVQMIEGSAAENGLPVGDQISVPVDTSDYTSIAASVGTDSISLLLGGPQAKNLISALAKQGNDLTEQIVTNTATLTSKDLEELGSAANGLYASYNTWPVTRPDLNPDVAQYTEDLEAAGHGDDVKDSFSLTAWSGAQVIGALLNASSDLTTEALLAHIETAGTIDAPALPSFDWSKPAVSEGPISQLRLFTSKVLPVQVRDGEVVPLTSDFVPFDEPITFTE